MTQNYHSLCLLPNYHLCISNFLVAGIKALPDELLLEIGRWVASDKTFLYSLSLVSKTFNAVMTQGLVRKLDVSLSTTTGGQLPAPYLNLIVSFRSQSVSLRYATTQASLPYDKSSSQGTNGGY